MDSQFCGRVGAGVFKAGRIHTGLSDVQSGVFDTPPGIGVGRKTINTIDLRKNGKYPRWVEQILLVDFQSAVVPMLNEVLAAAGAEIIDDPHLGPARICQERVDQVGSDESRSAGDNVNGSS
jgi:hypothetical protein